MEAVFRVLIKADAAITARLPLVEGSDSSQKFCGYGYEGDFHGRESNGAYGQIWEFVTHISDATEQALNSDSAVIIYVKL